MNSNIVDRLTQYYNGATVFTTKQLLDFSQILFDAGEAKSPDCMVRYAKSEQLMTKVSRGVYGIKGAGAIEAEDKEVPVVAEPAQKPVSVKVAEIVNPPATVTASSIAAVRESALYFPKPSAEFVPFGIYRDLVQILSSNVYAPVMITGDSGNGKTFSVVQAAAVAKRAIVTASIDYNTDDASLIGKFGLVNGNTVYEKGPVRIAMETGSVLLLDELDRGNPENLICLNALLDGYPVLDKQTGETLFPAPGFMVVATANTKGQGDDSDRFVAAKVLDEAFLERFPVILEQGYPSAAIETKILKKVCDDDSFVESLVKWAQSTRETYNSGAISNFITTRRLKMIAGKNFKIFNDREAAVRMAVARFDEMTRDAFVELYKAIDVQTMKAVSAKSDPNAPTAF